MKMLLTDDQLSDVYFYQTQALKPLLEPQVSPSEPNQTQSLVLPLLNRSQ